jgi:inward rectifier potassium channel
MTASWGATTAFLALVFVGYNVLFACVYLALGDVIAQAHPGNFEDAFFFSVQTMATIGYGVMTPRGTAANLVVSLEAFGGMLSAALTTGLVFAKFARPTARIRFSHTALVGTVNDAPVLMVRIANERNNRIMSATARLVLLRDEVTAEGARFRRMHELPLQRDSSVMFALSWTLMHTIDASSPLHGLSPDEVRAANAALIVTVSGTDEVLMQTVHARHAYDWESVVYGARFADVFEQTPSGRVLRLDRLHTYVAEDDT